MADSSVDVASQALARLGEPAISSFSDDSDTAEKVALLYEPTILGLFSSYDWRFAITRRQLVEDASGLPANEWTRGFLLPTLGTDRVSGPLNIFNSTAVRARPFFDYERQDRWIYTNATVIVMEYVQRKNEALWPGYFLQLAIEALAAALALPVTENASKDQLHRMNAFGSPSQNGRGGMFATAVEADTTGNPTRSLLDDNDILADARWGGRY
jgi:hypothetical protein